MVSNVKIKANVTLDLPTGYAHRATLFELGDVLTFQGNTVRHLATAPSELQEYKFSVDNVLNGDRFFVRARILTDNGWHKFTNIMVVDINLP